VKAIYSKSKLSGHDEVVVQPTKRQCVNTTAATSIKAITSPAISTNSTPSTTTSLTTITTMAKDVKVIFLGNIKDESSTKSQRAVCMQLLRRDYPEK
jgi:hypothetical protein